MSITRSSAIGLLLLSAAAHAGEQELRRAAALLDYVARGYGASVESGRVINAVEYEEQNAFAQEAAELLSHDAVGKPFAAEARQLQAEVQGKSAAVPAHALSLYSNILKAARLDTTPPPGIQGAVAEAFYGESCAACHGADGRGDGPAAKTLSTPATDFTGAARAQLTPYRVYSAITYGVPRTAMPSFGQQSEQRRWLLALHTLTFGTTESDARRGQSLARQRGLLPEAASLVAQSDADLRAAFATRGFPADDARALLAWVRRIAPFAKPPAAGFPALRDEVSVISIAYVHGELAEARQKLARARRDWSALEPLVEPAPASAVRAGFAEVAPLLSSPGANTRVLREVAQLARAIAEAPPESAPGSAELRRAGIKLSVSMGWPAALAVAALLVLALLRRPLLAMAAGLAAGGAAAIACRAAIRGCAVVAREYPGAGSEVSRGMIRGAVVLGAAGVAAGVLSFVLVRRGDRPFAAKARPPAP